ncbi:MAG: VRR-NUC domain-containing protein [Candidatus Kapabacteria bacterium]|nr:VRR-NUC domain-containing protein [Candidatus Kapabacteria bacterium]
MKESDIQASILKYVKAIGGFTFKVMTANTSGIPDVICCINGKFVALEIKLPGKNATELQKYKISEIQKAGGIASVVTSLDGAKEILNSL